MSRRQNLPTSRLHVQHLAEGTDESVLLDHFRPLGATDACLKVGSHDIFGFVQFESREEATAAKTQMNGRMVDGSHLKVSFANDQIALRPGYEKSLPPPRKVALSEQQGPVLTLDDLRRRHRARSVESRIGGATRGLQSGSAEDSVLVSQVSPTSTPSETSSDRILVIVVPINFKADGGARFDQLGQQIGNAIAACLQ